MPKYKTLKVYKSNTYYNLSIIVHSMEKQRNSGLFNTDAASALISTTDTLLNTSPLPSDPLLDIKEPDSGTLDPFVNIDGVDGDANTEEYTTPSKRIKTDV